MVGHRNRDGAHPSLSHPPVSRLPPQVSHGRLATARKPERQVTRMVVVMIVAFMVGWTPYAAFSIVVTACPTIQLDPRVGAIPAFFSKTAAVYNPVIYVYMNKQVAVARGPALCACVCAVALCMRRVCAGGCSCVCTRGVACMGVCVANVIHE